ncbi:hypothetical protein P7M68_24335, partial [Vibrio parahaemolyticus]|nr:hypothetical protein [Vibrio parahaemolyticus]
EKGMIQGSKTDDFPPNTQKMKQHTITTTKSTVATKGEGIVSLPGCPAGWTIFVVEMSSAP